MKATDFCFLLAAASALAQMDFSGEWAPVQDEDNTGNPYIGEFIGIPLSHASLLRSEAWEASYQTLPEWQCRPHGAMYISRGPSQVRIWKEVDPVTRQITAWHAEWLRSIDNPYYMDGRARPSEFAAHTWGGFSTAELVGDMLKITTTHLERRLLPAQRRPLERSGYAHAVLDPARRLPDVDHDRLRSGVFDGADDSQLRISVGAESADSALSVRRR